MLHRSALFIAILGFACGDNHAGIDGSTNVDDSGGSGSPDASHRGFTAAIAAGDFNPAHPGVLSAVHTGTLTAMQGVGSAGAVGDDPLLRHFGADLFVVNRSDGNNVTILDDHDFSLIDQLATGSNSNPQDVAIAAGKLYLPIYGGKGVAVVQRGSASIKTIDLSVDDPDGKPNCETAAVVDSDVYVACQLLNDTTFAPRGVGKVYVIDSATDTVRTKFDLTTKNPFGQFTQLADRSLVLGTVELSGSAAGSGCIEQITPGVTPTSACLVTNAVLGGFASRIEAAGPTLLALSVITATFSSETLAEYDISTTTATTISTAGEAIGDVGVCPDGTMVVADVTSGSAGVRVYSSGATEETTSPLPIGLPPSAQHGIECY